jgi:hypothetical protein
MKRIIRMKRGKIEGSIREPERRQEGGDTNSEPYRRSRNLLLQNKFDPESILCEVTREMLFKNFIGVNDLCISRLKQILI